MNYRNEMHHDWLLIELVNELARLNALHLLSDAFKIPVPQVLERSQRRKLFDVELTFSNLSCVIETKVDSNESGGWGNPYQTERIFRDTQDLAYLKQAKEYLFITYGTSEYYTKPYDRGPGSKSFRHITLNDMMSLVSRAIKMPIANPKQFDEWLTLMKVEQQKRASHVDILKSFSGFRKEYLAVHGDIDFPTNRLTFSAPELAFPAFSGIAEYWNAEATLVKTFGRVSVYPVARMTPPVHDSVLNFSEMWDSGKPSVGPRIAGELGKFYFEINEDYNLNLKFDSESLPESVRNEVWSRLESTQWSEGVRAKCRDYQQSAFALYEWDFDFLGMIGERELIGQRIASILEASIKALA